MSCIVVRITTSACLGSIVHVAILLLHPCLLFKTDASLPPGVEDEIVLIEHLPGRKVHLQDFFWNDVKDAPRWIRPDKTLTLYETRTVHHTATMYVTENGTREVEVTTLGKPDQPSPECPTCIDPTPTKGINDIDEDIGVLVGDDPGPRYWLLTVIQAGESVPPKVELRLAKLYKVAFARQQQRHLGILPKDIRYRRDALSNSTDPDIEFILYENSSTGFEVAEVIKMKPKSMRMIKMSNKDQAKFENYKVDNNNLDYDDTITSEDDSKLSRLVRSYMATLNNETKNDTKMPIRTTLVQVRMQNTTQSDEGATKLIYSVHLGGKPVPAETASKDMSLLSPQEVALGLGAPVIIQSQPYLNEPSPLALSRRKDAWLLLSATGAAIILFAIVLAVIIVLTKKKRALTPVATPQAETVLKSEREYTPTTTGRDNTGYTSETEIRTSQRRTPFSTTSRTTRTPVTPVSTAAGVEPLSSDSEDDSRAKVHAPREWKENERAVSAVTRKASSGHRRMSRSNAVESPKTPNSIDTVTDEYDGVEVDGRDEAAASPQSYLSMPSCKQFPDMRGVEPLNRLLETNSAKRVDVEETSPKFQRSHQVTPERRRSGGRILSRAASAVNDPGVVGPIVWDLRRARLEGTTSETDREDYGVARGPVGRARRRLHELLEDSFSLFGSRESNNKANDKKATISPETRPYVPNHLSILSENRGKSAQVSPVATPMEPDRSRPRTSLPKRGSQGEIPETGQVGLPPRGAWGSRPLSAGPFHRPSLPEVDTVRVLADGRLAQNDPAVPLIAAIKTELQKFSPECS